MDTLSDRQSERPRLSNAPSPLTPGTLAHESQSTNALAGTILTTRRWLTTVFTLAIASVLLIVISLRFGAEHMAFGEIISLLWHALGVGTSELDSASPSSVILLQVRLPRVLLSYLVGGCLAAVGVGLQALLRNPLADPYVLGVSSGAALGVSLAMLFGVGTAVLATLSLPVCAMLGGLLSIFIVYRIALSYGRLPVYTLLLAGVILNATFSSLIMFITSIMAPSRTFTVLQWLMGSLTAPSYAALSVLAAYVVIGGFILFYQAQSLNLLSLGDETARSLGVEVERVKKTVFFSSALLTGAVVSFSGMIGFVGMVIPHAVRMIIGPDHRLLLPAAALAGGTFLLAADTLARILLAPSEIPVGIITALAGGPFFLYLLINKKSRIAAQA